ncbi:hypothetical protein Tcan_10587 [Toxocara canis]|uniref:Uncharacterized protein n=1 Tax=Toxocara canis TaxID=6265 RepID=A0A0B2UU78_TOXCA|nr:hypothetical protein Tcan_10587 [Toxocara canis]
MGFPRVRTFQPDEEGPGREVLLFAIILTSTIICLIVIVIVISVARHVYYTIRCPAVIHTDIRCTQHPECFAMENSTQSSCSFERGDETIRRHLSSDKILNLRHATQTLRASMKTTMISPIPTLSVSSTLPLSTTDVPSCSLGGSSRSLIYDTNLTHES